MNWQTILKKKKRHPALVRAGVSGFSKPKRIKHKTKSHIVVVKDGDKVKWSPSKTKEKKNKNWRKGS